MEPLGVSPSTGLVLGSIPTASAIERFTNLNSKKMKNSELIYSFVAGTARDGQHTNSVSVDGNRLFSYATCIAERVGNKIVVNETKYSVTTSKHQSYLYGALRRYNECAEYVNGILRGCSRLVG